MQRSISNNSNRSNITNKNNNALQSRRHSKQDEFERQHEQRQQKKKKQQQQQRIKAQHHFWYQIDDINGPYRLVAFNTQQSHTYILTQNQKFIIQKKYRQIYQNYQKQNNQNYRDTLKFYDNLQIKLKSENECKFNKMMKEKKKIEEQIMLEIKRKEMEQEQRDQQRNDIERKKNQRRKMQRENNIDRERECMIEKQRESMIEKKRIESQSKIKYYQNQFQKVQNQITQLKESFNRQMIIEKNKEEQFLIQINHMIHQDQLKCQKLKEKINLKKQYLKNGTKQFIRQALAAKQQQKNQNKINLKRLKKLDEQDKKNRAKQQIQQQQANTFQNISHQQIRYKIDSLIQKKQKDLTYFFLYTVIIIFSILLYKTDCYGLFTEEFNHMQFMEDNFLSISSIGIFVVFFVISKNLGIIGVLTATFWNIGDYTVQNLLSYVVQSIKQNNLIDIKTIPEYSMYNPRYNVLVN